MTTSNYLYDGQNPLADFTGIISSPTFESIYTPALGIDELISRKMGPDTQYYLRDGLNSVRNVLNIDGTNAITYDYSPYGAVKNVTGISDNNITFTGRRSESNNSLMYYRTRYYDSKLGRFLKKDIYFGDIGKPLSLNHYSYVLASPINYIDPEGTSAVNLFNLINRAAYYSEPAVTNDPSHFRHQNLRPDTQFGSKLTAYEEKVLREANINLQLNTCNSKLKAKSERNKNTGIKINTDVNQGSTYAYNQYTLNISLDDETDDFVCSYNYKSNSVEVIGRIEPNTATLLPPEGFVEVNYCGESHEKNLFEHIK